VNLVRRALAHDLDGAYKADETVRPLAQIIYRFGEPSSNAHQRMKCARWLMGQFSSPVVRRPVRPLPAAEVERIRSELEQLGLR
jgi:4-hydroxy-tetrahydrodipicolinate synthase